MAVFFDAVSDGGIYNGDPISFGPGNLRWNHYGNGADRAVLVAVSYAVFGGTLVNLTRTATCNGVAMASLGVIASPSSTTDPHFTEVFGLIGPPPGKSAIQVLIEGVFLARRKVRAAAVSYTGVESFGTVTTSSGTGTSLSVTGTAASAAMVVGVFGTEGGLVGYTQQQRYLSNTVMGLAVGDAVGTGSSTTFAVTRSRSNKWGALSIPLVAADVVGIPTPVAGQAIISASGRRLPRPGISRRTVFNVPLEM